MRELPWAPLVRVSGSLMLPTLGPGDILVTRPVLGRVARGDVVVVASSGRRYVKRVVGRGSDVVEMEAGRLRVNGRWLDPPPPGIGAPVARWVVPAGHLFVAGDNRVASSDSRSWERPFVPVAAVRGVALTRAVRSHPAWM